MAGPAGLDTRRRPIKDLWFFLAPSGQARTTIPLFGIFAGLLDSRPMSPMRELSQPFVSAPLQSSRWQRTGKKRWCSSTSEDLLNRQVKGKNLEVKEKEVAPTTKSVKAVATGPPRRMS